MKNLDIDRISDIEIATVPSTIANTAQDRYYQQLASIKRLVDAG